MSKARERGAPTASQGPKFKVSKTGREMFAGSRERSRVASILAIDCATGCLKHLTALAILSGSPRAGALFLVDRLFRNTIARTCSLFFTQAGGSPFDSRAVLLTEISLQRAGLPRSAASAYSAERMRSTAISHARPCTYSLRGPVPSNGGRLRRIEARMCDSRTKKSEK